jgi:hypothetical protein
MFRRRSFTANGENYEVRGVELSDETAARAYDCHGKPASSAYAVSEEIAQDMRATGTNPVEKLMNLAQADAEIGHTRATMAAIAVLDNPPEEN